MNLLAIDSCASVLSVAVSKGGQILYTDTESGMKHSELIMDCIDGLMNKADLKPCDINAVLCMGGPGSFTGLRIGFSVAKGLAFSLSIPFIPIPSLDCIAYSNRGGGLTIAVIEARKNAWFFAVYHNEKSIIPAADADAGKIIQEINNLASTYNEKITLTGHGAASLCEVLPDDLKKKIIINTEKRGFSSELIAFAKTENLTDNCNKALPNTALLYSGPEYIRKTDAELNLKNP